MPKIEKHVADGLKVLRERIAKANIPSSKLDETLNFAAWNIRHFGAKYKGEYRTDAAILYIAEVLRQFDFIAITELRDELGDMERVLRVLGPTWRLVFSDYNTEAGGNRERIGFLFDKRQVHFTGLAAEADEPRVLDPKTGEYVSQIIWWRSPYMASFSSGRFDFIVLAAHIRWGDKPADRAKELRMLANWVKKRVGEKGAVDRDIFVVGDMNVAKVGDDLYKALTEAGLEIPKELIGKHGTNLAKTEHYDQILHYSKDSRAPITAAGKVDFYDSDHAALFPPSKYPNIKGKEDFTYQLSDHLPLWMQIDTTSVQEDLDTYFAKVLVAPNA